jgi:hypothetical protein
LKNANIRGKNTSVVFYLFQQISDMAVVLAGISPKLLADHFLNLLVPPSNAKNTSLYLPTAVAFMNRVDPLCAGTTHFVLYSKTLLEQGTLDGR